MKKIFLGLTLAGSLLMNAQEKEQPATSKSPVRFGVKAGFNASTFSDSNNEYSDYNEKVKLGSHVGVFVNIPVAEKFSVQPELLFSQMGSKTEEKYTYMSVSDAYLIRQEFSYTTNLNYLTLPMMVQYKILPQLYVEAGPEFGYLLGGKSKGDQKTENTFGGTTTVSSNSFSNKIPMELYKRFNFGIGIGAGYYFTQNFGVTARFTAGITGLFKNNDYNNKIRNNALQIGVAYQFK
ncbi:outer membrane protein with beta-barrel domain [Chryseobacterium sp. 7]|uniref:porin family protein n=1 Tax=Chryseobacterium sp. 7 TaxID=2035214 RepID=UPI000EAE7B2D|nr:porin family protein [Chryseobacterium sp. 7]RLJ32521.1 outer membrane protein with beta-barrel domain [Chryseobacterium sp. 7]